MEAPRLVIADGHLGIWAAVRKVWPEAEEQRGWNHRILNTLEKIPKRLHKSALLILRQIPYAESRQEAERLKKVFQSWCQPRDLKAAARVLDEDWERMVVFSHNPKAHRQHLMTTNPVESAFAALRLRTDAAKRFKKVAKAQAVIWKRLLGAEKRVRRLRAPELMKDVYHEARYVDGVAVSKRSEEEAA